MIRHPQRQLSGDSNLWRSIWSTFCIVFHRFPSGNLIPLVLSGIHRSKEHPTPFPTSYVILPVSFLLPGFKMALSQILLSEISTCNKIVVCFILFCFVLLLFSVLGNEPWAFCKLRKCSTPDHWTTHAIRIAWINKKIEGCTGNIQYLLLSKTHQSCIYILNPGKFGV